MKRFREWLVYQLGHRCVCTRRIEVQLDDSIIVSGTCEWLASLSEPEVLPSGSHLVVIDARNIRR